MDSCVSRQTLLDDYSPSDSWVSSEMMNDTTCLSDVSIAVSYELAKLHPFEEEVATWTKNYRQCLPLSSMNLSLSKSNARYLNRST